MPVSRVNFQGPGLPKVVLEVGFFM